MTEIIAHRGSSGNAPENTMYAFETAVRDGADAIETDVRKTSDGVLIIMHDSRLLRLCGDEYADFNVTEHTWDEMKDIDISSKNHPEAPVQHIVLLSELLELVKRTGIRLNIEIKPNEKFDDGLEFDVMNAVKRAGVEGLVFYSCFDHALLRRMKDRDGTVLTAPLYSNVLYNVGEYAKSLDAFAVHPSYNAELRSDSAKTRESGMMINVWTVNDANVARELVKRGVTGLITNFPREIRDAVSDK